MSDLKNLSGGSSGGISSDSTNLQAYQQGRKDAEARMDHERKREDKRFELIEQKREKAERRARMTRYWIDAAIAILGAIAGHFIPKLF